MRLPPAPASGSWPTSQSGGRSLLRLVGQRRRQSPERALEVAFGVDKKVALDHDAVAVADTLHNFHVLATAFAQFNITWFEPAVAQIDDDDLPAIAVDHRACRHRHHWFVRTRGDFDVGVH